MLNAKIVYADLARESVRFSFKGSEATPHEKLLIKPLKGKTWEHPSKEGELKEIIQRFKKQPCYDDLLVSVLQPGEYEEEPTVGDGRLMAIASLRMELKEEGKVLIRGNQGGLKIVHPTNTSEGDTLPSMAYAYGLTYADAEGKTHTIDASDIYQYNKNCEDKSKRVPIVNAWVSKAKYPYGMLHSIEDERNDAIGTLFNTLKEPKLVNYDLHELDEISEESREERLNEARALGNALLSDLQNSMFYDDKEALNFILSYFGYRCVNPFAISNLYIIAKGMQGSGKNTLLSYIPQILVGEDNVSNLSLEVLKESFNRYAFSKQFITLNETVQDDERTGTADKLKTLVSEHTSLSINEKNVKRIDAEFYGMISLATNNKKPVNLDFDDRRAIIAYCKAARPSLKETFHKVEKNIVAKYYIQQKILALGEKFNPKDMIAPPRIDVFDGNFFAYQLDRFSVKLPNRRNGFENMVNPIRRMLDEAKTSTDMNGNDRYHIYLDEKEYAAFRNKFYSGSRDMTERHKLAQRGIYIDCDDNSRHLYLRATPNIESYINNHWDPENIQMKMDYKDDKDNSNNADTY